ncbi:hypothetical protein Y032_0306g1981 [Ancylostoma ceylanicum]|uniref:Uncharacterized protein n=1 Tax=Ancylostoma ceylanicum TaxID=53326 RepID=A0A016S401_9BILA|nr:hypothetical protein Y032_0306g1981 [Ancylostoma ceylanicum]
MYTAQGTLQRCFTFNSSLYLICPVLLFLVGVLKVCFVSGSRKPVSARIPRIAAAILLGKYSQCGRGSLRHWLGYLSIFCRLIWRQCQRRAAHNRYAPKPVSPRLRQSKL